MFVVSVYDHQPRSNGTAIKPNNSRHDLTIVRDARSTRWARAAHRTFRRAPAPASTWKRAREGGARGVRSLRVATEDARVNAAPTKQNAAQRRIGGWAAPSVRTMCELWSCMWWDCGSFFFGIVRESDRLDHWVWSRFEIRDRDRERDTEHVWLDD